MGPIASVATAVIIVVFVVAAAAKTTRPPTVEFQRLRLPAPRLLAIVVPAVEWVTVILLLLLPGLGAVVALALLALFTAVLTRALAEGDEVACSCFGSLSSRPVSAATLGRNAVLMAIAALAATSPGWARPDIASVVVVGGLAVIGFVAVEAIALRATLGRLWSVELAGEAGRAPRRSHQIPTPRGSQP